jgi:hypothetical protein
MLTSTRINSVQPYADSGNIVLVVGAFDGYPSDRASVIVAAFDTASRAVVGKAVASSTGRFAIPIGPFEKGTRSITACLLQRDGTLQLDSSSNAFTFVVRDADAQLPDGMVDISPPYQS